jgi:hypothetical protein
MRPCNFDLFPRMKEHLLGKQFFQRENIQQAAR